MTDNVNHPDHYTQGGVECIDAMEAATVSKKGTEAICTSNIIKYLWRYEAKNGLEDVKKARWYLDRLITELEGKPAVTPAKTQMQIVQEGIDRLDKLDREAFVQTLVDAGIVEELPAVTPEPECDHDWEYYGMSAGKDEGLHPLRRCRWCGKRSRQGE